MRRYDSSSINLQSAFRRFHDTIHFDSRSPSILIGLLSYEESRRNSECDVIANSDVIRDVIANFKISSNGL